MTIGKVIRLADALKPNAIGREQKYQYINEVEGLVQSEVMLLVSDDIVTYDCDATGADDTVLLVKPPHDKLYIAYLVAMIDYANGEYNKYANTIEQFNTYYAEYHRWYFKHFHPADGECIERGYYLSAYAIAVKYGYAGTEEEWVASLNGKTPELRYNDANVLEWKYTVEGDDAWRELVDVGEIERLRDEAQGAAVTAEEKATIAQQAMTNAQGYAAAAEDYKNQANTQANFALELASTAYQHEQNAKSYAEQAKENSTLGMTAAKVGDYAKVAEVDENGIPTRFEASEGAGGSFIVTLTKTDGVYSADKTFAQIGEAVGKGLCVLVSYGKFFYRLAIKNNGVAYFTFASNFSEGAAVCMVSCSSEDVWNDTIVLVEKTENRVTAISSASTDTQYPSAKAVYTLAENTKTFIVKVTDGSTITADRTFAQIRTAINSGRIVAAKYNNDILMPAAFYDSSTTEVSFAAVMPTTNGYTIVKMLKCTSGNVWSYATYNLEHQNDMVTTINASSSNSKYPSAKAVYDFVGSQLGDVVSLINAI